MATTPTTVDVHLDANGRIKPARRNSDAAKTYEYMIAFATWLINKSNASADLKARVNKFYTDLKTAVEWNEEQGAYVLTGGLPAHSIYMELVRAYNAEIDNRTVTRQPVASVPQDDDTDADEPDAAPAPTPAPRQSRPTPPPPVAAPATTSTQADPDDTPAPQPAAGTTPPATATGEPTLADILAAVNGVKPMVDNHEATLNRVVPMVDEHELLLRGNPATGNPGLETRMRNLEGWAYGDDGFDPATQTLPPVNRSRTTDTSSTDTTNFNWKPFVWVPLLTIFVVMLLIGLIGAGVDYGFIAAMSRWLWVGFVSLLIAILAVFLWQFSHSTPTTASAVTREERN